MIGNVDAELGELLDVRVDFLLAIELHVVVRAEVFEFAAVEHEVNRD